MSAFDAFDTARTILVNLLGELLAPSRCAACDRFVAPDVLFCSPCAMTNERVLLRGEPEFEPSAAKNSEIQARRDVAVFMYGGAITTAISRLKYEDRADLGPRLGRLMIPAAKLICGSLDLVIPVPLHPRRLAERGYNQAALLAAPVAQSIDVPADFLTLRRRRDTPRQATLRRSSRLANVLASFSVVDPSRVRDRRIVLVDDVRTTGATLKACADALHQAGARLVHTLVLAKAAHDETHGEEP